eukprot:TRINITY_DN19099_c0_g1_i1.p1 TRINITY_DN19099_c0_g1~~TRINITY_DN19099_c0_g1_i1.p1  ORF type:complete len:572 (+),score=173.62 TRINITY_DN19099_c0_g1_i1:240-1718(+)
MSPQPVPSREPEYHHYHHHQQHNHSHGAARPPQHPPVRRGSPQPFAGSCSTTSLSVSRNGSDVREWGGTFTGCVEGSLGRSLISRGRLHLGSYGMDCPEADHTQSESGDEAMSDASSSDDGASRIGTHLQLIDELGRGSYGVVYKVLHRLDGKYYAVKKSLRAVEGHVTRENRLQEVYSLAALPRCLHIVKYHDCWFEQNHLHIRFEYCEGGTIASVPPHKWTYASILDLFFQLLTGLKCLHQVNVVHLDVKPENIYITRANGEIIYKLGDFGLVRKINKDATQHWVGENRDEGDARYLCQAFLRGAGSPKAADVFSLAATIYEMARGMPLPVQGDEWEYVRSYPAADIEDRYKPEFIQLIKSCMEKEPHKRPDVPQICENGIFDDIKAQCRQPEQVAAKEACLRSWRQRIAERRREREAHIPAAVFPEAAAATVPATVTTHASPPDRSGSGTSSQGLSPSSAEAGSSTEQPRTLYRPYGDQHPVPPPLPLH